MTLSPPAELDSRSEDWLQLLLDCAQWTEEDIEAIARDTSAITRRRRIHSGVQLLTLLMSYVVSDPSLRDVTALASLYNSELSDEALRQRFHKAKGFIETLLTAVFTAELETPTGTKRVLIGDGTSLSVPGSKGTDLRLHTLMQLGGQGGIQIELTDGHVAESMFMFDLHHGDLLLADSEFCRAKEIEQLVAAGVDVLVRFRNQQWPGTPAKNWVKQLKAMHAGSRCTFTQSLSSGKPVYVHVLALSEEEANEAGRKKRVEHQRKKGKPPSELTLLLCGYVILLTTVEPSKMSSKSALDWYRRRWQIELLFKRQKSLLGLNDLRSKRTSTLTYVKVLMKLLYAWLVDKSSRFDATLSEKRDMSIWRAWRWAREYIRMQIWQVLWDWRRAEPQVLDALAERPRKRRTQKDARDILEVLIG